MAQRGERLAEYRHNSGVRGNDIRDAVCAWVRRWGYSSNNALGFLYPGRPRLGREYAKRNLLERIEIEPGRICTDGRLIYRCAPEAELRALSFIPPVVADIEVPARISWPSLQHTLDLQRIAIHFGMTPGDASWRTEAELRAISGDDELVPDLVTWIDAPTGERGLWWIEYDRSPKGAVAREYWTQRLSEATQSARDMRDPEHPSYEADPKRRSPLIHKITVVVPLRNLADRYDRAFSRRNVPYRRRDENRRLYEVEANPYVQIADVLRSITEVVTLDEVFMEPARSPEEQREAVLASRFTETL